MEQHVFKHVQIRHFCFHEKLQSKVSVRCDGKL